MSHQEGESSAQDKQFAIGWTPSVSYRASDALLAVSFQDKIVLASHTMSKTLSFSELVLGLLLTPSYLVVSDNAKRLTVYSIDLVSLTLKMIAQTTLDRKAIMLKSPPCSDEHDRTLLVGDRKGDLIAFRLPALDAQRLLLGHIPALLDFTFMDDQHVVTVDRDGRVRVSRYPQAYVIDRFVFHTGGDEVTRCAKYLFGDIKGGIHVIPALSLNEKQADKHELSKPVSAVFQLGLPTQLLLASSSHAMAVGEKSGRVVMLSPAGEKTGERDIQGSIVTGILVSEQEALLFVAQDQQCRLEVVSLALSSGAQTVPQEVLQGANQQLTAIPSLLDRFHWVQYEAKPAGHESQAESQ
jgi:hypothetical protein